MEIDEPTLTGAMLDGNEFRLLLSALILALSLGPKHGMPTEDFLAITRIGDKIAKPIGRNFSKDLFEFVQQLAKKEDEKPIAPRTTA